MCQVIDRALREASFEGHVETLFPFLEPGRGNTQWVEFGGYVAIPPTWGMTLRGRFVGHLVVQERHGGRIVATHYLNTARIDRVTWDVGDTTRCRVEGCSVGPYETMPTDAREP